MRDAKRSSSTAVWAASPDEVAEMLGELAGLDARSGARLAAVLRARPARARQHAAQPEVWHPPQGMDPRRAFPRRFRC